MFHSYMQMPCNIYPILINAFEEYRSIVIMLL